MISKLINLNENTKPKLTFFYWFSRVLELEEEYIKSLCDDIIKAKPDLVITEKGISDLAQHFLVKANITAIRRLRKSDNNRIAR